MHNHNNGYMKIEITIKVRIILCQRGAGSLSVKVLPIGAAG